MFILLPLSDAGLPKDNVEKTEVLEKIYDKAISMGIAHEDIIVDGLVTTVGANAAAGVECFDTIAYCKDVKKLPTICGLSNISFGLPNRDAVNGTFFAMALQNGLSAAIMNPFSQDMLKTYYTYRALMGYDTNCEEYIGFAPSITAAAASTATQQTTAAEEYKSALQKAIVKGLKEQAGELTAKLLEETEPLEIVQKEVIPALDIVGKGYEAKTVYLPQLLMAAHSRASHSSS